MVVGDAPVAVQAPIPIGAATIAITHSHFLMTHRIPRGTPPNVPRYRTTRQNNARRPSTGNAERHVGCARRRQARRLSGGLGHAANRRSGIPRSDAASRVLLVDGYLPRTERDLNHERNRREVDGGVRLLGFGPVVPDQPSRRILSNDWVLVAGGSVRRCPSSMK